VGIIASRPSIVDGAVESQKFGKSHPSALSGRPWKTDFSASLGKGVFLEKKKTKKISLESIICNFFNFPKKLKWY